VIYEGALNGRAIEGTWNIKGVTGKDNRGTFKLQETQKTFEWNGEFDQLKEWHVYKAHLTLDFDKAVVGSGEDEYDKFTFFGSWNNRNVTMTKEYTGELSNGKWTHKV
jgi:hypothetical protein